MVSLKLSDPFVDSRTGFKNRQNLYEAGFAGVADETNIAPPIFGKMALVNEVK